MRQIHEVPIHNDLSVRAQTMKEADALPKAPASTKTIRMQELELEHGVSIEHLLYDDDPTLTSKTNTDRAKSLGINVSTLRRWRKKIQHIQPVPIAMPELDHLSQSPLELTQSEQRVQGAERVYKRVRGRSNLTVGFIEFFSSKFSNKPSSYRERLETARKTHEK